jgi:hypothetical protein
LLDIRLVVARRGGGLAYTNATNARSPYVSLGRSSCGAGAHSPSTPRGWCSPFDGSELATSFDTSSLYMASGYLPSADGAELYFYAMSSPQTHGGLPRAPVPVGANEGIRVLRVRADGFVAVEVYYYGMGSRAAIYNPHIRYPAPCNTESASSRSRRRTTSDRCRRA